MGKVTIIGIVVAVLLVFISGFIFLSRQTEDSGLPQELAPVSVASIDLGITYLPLTPRLSAYYNLGVDSGALVTEVAPNSPAERAGLEAGDVILSFNGARVGKEITLLGMMRTCPVGNDIMLEVWRGKDSRVVKLVNVEN